MKNKKLTMLITCVGGTMAPAFLYELKNKSKFDLKFVGIDSFKKVELPKRILSSFYQIKTSKDKEYMPKIKEIIEDEEIDVILPYSDEEAFQFAKSKEIINKMGVKVIVSDYETLNLLRDKGLVYNKLKKDGIKIPEYKIVRNAGEFEESLDEFNYPKETLICKPSIGRGGRGIHVLQGEKFIKSEGIDENERRKQISKGENLLDILESYIKKGMLVMPMLDKPAYDVDILSSKGKTLANVVRKRINPAGIPFKGNFIIKDEKIEKYCKSISESVKLNSLHDIDLMTDKKGDTVLLEINPRPSGSLVASLCAGIPFVDMAIEKEYGENVENCYIKEELFIGTYCGVYKKILKG